MTTELVSAKTDPKTRKPRKLHISNGTTPDGRLIGLCGFVAKRKDVPTYRATPRGRVICAECRSIQAREFGRTF